jgi:uncharacterized membrane protein
MSSSDSGYRTFRWQIVEAIMANPKSTAQIAGHPIHPMLIPFPIAFLVSALVCDLVFWWTGYRIWATAAMWLLGFGALMGLLAGVFGLIDYFVEPKIRDLTDAKLHGFGNIAIVLIAAFNWYRRYDLGEAAVLPWGLVLSLIIVAMLVFTGWKGWDMIYRSRVAISDAP